MVIKKFSSQDMFAKYNDIIARTTIYLQHEKNCFVYFICHILMFTCMDLIHTLKSYKVTKLQRNCFVT